MKKLLLLLLFFLIFFVSCTAQTNEILYKEVVSNFDDLQSSISVDYAKNILPLDWYDYYREIILQNNPSFKIINSDSINFLLIPYLIVDVENIGNEDTDLIRYMGKGSFSIDNCWLLIFKNNKQVGIFFVEDRIIPAHFDEYLTNTFFGDFMNYDAYFKILIKGKRSQSLIPGIFILKDNELKVLDQAGNIFPINEIYKTLYNNQAEFDNYLKTIVEINRQ